MENKKICFLLLCALAATSAHGQAARSAKLDLHGTRSWIRVETDNDQDLSGARVYWSKERKKPAQPNAVIDQGKSRYYIQKIDPETTYYVWLESETGALLGKGAANTTKSWALDSRELREEHTNPSSAAVPKGMEVYWQDEFNDDLLNLNKWSTNYFSSLNYFNRKSRQEMQEDKLPQPAYTLDGKYINLYVNDTLPKRLYNEGGNQKVSSIQTYDWRTNENLLDNSRGGYFEVKVKRNRKGNPKGMNTAFWFDAPGPDSRYFLQQGTEVEGIKGIRPKGQVFEIDIFEYINAQFVLHGHVNEKGRFQKNLATHIAEGYNHVNQWVTHGILWTPTSVKHYINGNLIKEYTDKKQIYSPNHFMNVFLGTYGSDGEVNMEVDYIRAYNWPLRDGNELPNPDFEQIADLGPWEGEGIVQSGIGEKNSKGVILPPGKHIEQYIYLEPNKKHELNYWAKGEKMEVNIEDVTPVVGDLSTIKKHDRQLSLKGKKASINFITGSEIFPNKKTLRIAFENTGEKPVYLDNITLKKK
ncbi:MAG: glycoside hydrolase family 16 protein [Sphingobacterium sp.]|nr:glycoside hydrolase family 16 protein [Sphingobacterium sp.]